MPWPFACAHCGSRDVQPLVDEIQCLVCGRLTDRNSMPVSRLDQFTSEEKL